MPLDYPGGNYHDLGRDPPQLHPVVRKGRFMFNFRPDSKQSDAFCDDYTLMFNQASTHWDALAHIGTAFDIDGTGIDEIVYYNGYRANRDIVGPVGDGYGRSRPEDASSFARALGIENMAVKCVQGRGVMIDLHSAFGRERKFVGYDDLMRICDADAVEVERGDMVCFHTGLTHALMSLKRNPDKETLENSHPVLDSRDERLLRWIDESGVAALIADNFAIEGVPARPDPHARSIEPLHQLCIPKLGIPLGELWYLHELNSWLRQRKRSRFLLTAPPLRLPGAVGSPVTPVATV
jgi:kynurenine formamidase